jgi:hypothetical protein
VTNLVKLYLQASLFTVAVAGRQARVLTFEQARAVRRFIR